MEVHAIRDITWNKHHGEVRTQTHGFRKTVDTSACIFDHHIYPCYDPQLSRLPASFLCIQVSQNYNQTVQLHSRIGYFDFFWLKINPYTQPLKCTVQPVNSNVLSWSKFLSYTWQEETFHYNVCCYINCSKWLNQNGPSKLFPFFSVFFLITDRMMNNKRVSSTFKLEIVLPFLKHIFANTNLQFTVHITIHKGSSG